MIRLSLEDREKFRTILRYSPEAFRSINSIEFEMTLKELTPFKLTPVSLYSTEEGISHQLDEFRGLIGFIYLFVEEHSSPKMIIAIKQFPVRLTL